MKKLFLFVIMAMSVAMISAQTKAETEKTPRKHNVNRLSENYFIPGRFEGKTILSQCGYNGLAG